MTRPKKLHHDVLQETARIATQSALESHPPIPELARETLTLGAITEGDTICFELYVPGERPTDAILFTTVRLNSYSGEVLSIQVHDSAWSQFA